MDKYLEEHLKICESENGYSIINDDFSFREQYVHDIIIAHYLDLNTSYYIEFLCRNFNGFLYYNIEAQKNSVFFNNKSDAEMAIKWILTIPLMNKLEKS